MIQMTGMFQAPVRLLDVSRLARYVGAERQAALMAQAAQVREAMAGRVLWNVNSTATGGGLAEMLAQLVAYASGAGVARNDSIAHALCDGACRDHDSEGCFQLGKLYEMGQGVEQDFTHAANLYRRACNDESGDACFAIAALYERGAGVRRDTTRAQDLRERACKLGRAAACTSPRAGGA